MAINDCRKGELTPPPLPLETSCSGSSKPEVPLGSPSDNRTMKASQGCEEIVVCVVECFSR